MTFSQNEREHLKRLGRSRLVYGILASLVATGEVARSADGGASDTYHPPIVLGRLEDFVVFTLCLCYYQMTYDIRYIV